MGGPRCQASGSQVLLRVCLHGLEFSVLAAVAQPYRVDAPGLWGCPFLGVDHHHSMELYPGVNQPRDLSN